MRQLLRLKIFQNIPYFIFKKFHYSIYLISGNIAAVFTTRSFGENLAKLVETSYSEVNCSISEGQRLVRQLTK